MNILFLTLVNITSLEVSGAYTDLLREFVRRGDHVYVVSAAEKRTGEQTRLIQKETFTLLRVKCGNITKTNIIEKGISTLTIGAFFHRAVKRFLRDIPFDLIIYTTPPVTILPAIRSIRRETHAKTYLLLKDIFPQNAVDLGMMRKGGLLYRYFRSIEKGLYAVSGRIGCMSPANVRFLLEHNPSVRPDDVEIFPNCQEIREVSVDNGKKQELRRRYGLSEQDTVFVLGGNLSSGHDFAFALRCFHELEKQGENIHLLFVGAGTEVVRIQDFIQKNNSKKISYVPSLPVEEYEELVSACDVGLILLDNRFTIPNFPSRLLSYMEAKKPVFSITDDATDVGEIAERNGFGWQCRDGDEKGFADCIHQIQSSDLKAMGEQAFAFMEREYDVSKNIQKLIDYATGSTKENRRS